MADRLRIVVTGLAVTFPFGGVFWDYMNYVLGFHRLGHEVLYLEDTGQWCYLPEDATFVPDGARNAKMFGQFLRQLEPELADSWHYRDAGGSAFGLPRNRVLEFCRRADLFINVSATALLRDEYLGQSRRVFIDSDPMYTQALVPAYSRGELNEDGRYRMSVIQAHDVHFTFGENVGSEDCSVPVGLFDWMPTRQPVVLDQFTNLQTPRERRRHVLTTVGSWQPSTTPLTVGGVTYYGKSTQMERFIDLPSRVSVPLELALSGDVPRDRFTRHGWMLKDPLAVSADPWSYRDYLSASFGEWSVAKDAYVVSRSGWFSGRSACFLAAGVPVIVQDTGFGSVFPTGEGVLPFSAMENAIGAVEEVVGNYEFHCARAEDIAREYFDSSIVLSQLIDDVHAGPNS